MPRSKETFNSIRERTREKIETAALSLFARKGLSVTVDEIAREAGLSKGLLYNHYPSKDALIIEFVRRATEISSRNIQNINICEAPASEKIKQITSMMCQIFSDQPIAVEYFMFMVQVDMSGFLVPDTAKYTQHVPNPIEILTHVISQGQDEGTVVDGDALRLSIVYWATFQGLCCYSITGMPLSLDPKTLSRILLKESCL